LIANEIYKVLLKLSKDMGKEGKDNIFGYGLVKFCNTKITKR